MRAGVVSVFECTVVDISVDHRDLGRDHGSRRETGPCGFGHPSMRGEEPSGFDFLNIEGGGADGG